MVETPQEWVKKLNAAVGKEAAVRAEGQGFFVRIYDRRIPRWAVLDDIRPQVARIALHGQPFGFTSADVAMLRDASDAILRSFPSDMVPVSYPAEKLQKLADRIEALL